MIELQDVKEHLRVVGEHEDNYLNALTLAACKLFEAQTGRILVKPQELPADEPKAVELDDLIKWGLLLTIGHWYENREATTSLTLAEIPLGVAACWGPYRFYNLGGATP